MPLWLIISLVLFLYLRTIKYKYIIDDNIKRDGYLYQIPIGNPTESFYQTRPSVAYRLFMIGMHCVNVSVVYLLWGWGAALLFAVHPMAVWVTAWVTGNYYGTTAYFLLITYYILQVFPNAYGALIGMAIYASALNSTISSVVFPFLFIGSPWGLTLFFPLFMFLRGKRFQTGIAIRDGFKNETIAKSKFCFRRLFFMTKTMAHYAYYSIVPSNLGLFGPYGRNIRNKQEVYDKSHSANGEFWASLALLLTLFIIGLAVHPEGVLWFFSFLALHSQWNLNGQLFAQRYLYLPVAGVCAIAGTILAPYPYVLVVIATIYAYRTWMFTPAFRDIDSLYLNDLEAYPGHAIPLNNASHLYLTRYPKGGPVAMYHQVGAWLTRAYQIEPDSYEVAMNLAAYYFALGNVDKAIWFTKLSVAGLEPLGGPPEQLNKLKEQLTKLEKFREERRLGDSLSLDSHGKQLQTGGRDHGKSEKETTEHYEYNGSCAGVGGEAGVRGSLAGV